MSTVAGSLKIWSAFVESFTEAELPGSSANNRTAVYDGLDGTVALDAASTPPISAIYPDKLTGTNTIDLTALPKDVGATVDFDGKKVVICFVKNLSALYDLTISDGAANGYSLNGGNDLVIPPNGQLPFDLADGLTDVDATHKNLTFTPGGGTFGDSAEYLVMLVAG